MKKTRNIMLGIIAAVGLLLVAAPVIADSCFGTREVQCPQLNNYGINGHTYTCTSTNTYPTLITVANGWMNSLPVTTTCRYTCVRQADGQTFVVTEDVTQHSYKAWAFPIPGALPCTSSGGGSGGNGS